MSYIRSRKETDHDTGRIYIYPYPPTRHLIDNAYHIERSLRLSTHITYYPFFSFYRIVDLICDPRDVLYGLGWC